ncbi:MAG: glycosyltransferase [Deltaproteobacteria bacterium]|nr:glycosyltransferase [Deltaproteobacteria bacterium]
MKVFYLTSNYVSHAKAGAHYIQCLRLLGHELVESPQEADVCVLHDEPDRIPCHVERWPTLRTKPIVGYFVWELERLPQKFIPHLELVDQIWTPSSFSAAAFSGHNRVVRVLPHVVERVSPSRKDTEFISERLGLSAGHFRSRATIFYTICDARNARKNIAVLLRAFALLPRNRARLVVKQYRHALDLSGLPGVISLPEDLSEKQISALHALCDAYVSPHRGEAWGLGISEAMAHGKLVLATGWSGNMEYMNIENALCLDFRLGKIEEEDLHFLPPVFEVGMRWAEVDERELVTKMNDVVCGRVNPEIGGKARLAMDQFSMKRIAGKLDSYLNEVANLKRVS